jgi:hypothetical protein
MAEATYFYGTGAASWSSRPCNAAGAPSLVFIPNASTHGPPTTSAVLANPERIFAVTEVPPANQVRGATDSGYDLIWIAPP